MASDFDIYQGEYGAPSIAPSPTPSIYVDGEAGKQTITANNIDIHTANRLIDAPKPCSVKIIEHPEGGREVIVEGTEDSVNNALLTIYRQEQGRDLKVFWLGLAKEPQYLLAFLCASLAMILFFWTVNKPQPAYHSQVEVHRYEA